MNPAKQVLRALWVAFYALLWWWSYSAGVFTVAEADRTNYQGTLMALIPIGTIGMVFIIIAFFIDHWNDER